MKTLVIETDGSITTIYDDDLPPVGPRKMERAASVEPDEDGLWSVTMSYSELNGRIKGVKMASGTVSRAAALQTEHYIVEKALHGLYQEEIQF